MIELRVERPHNTAESREMTRRLNGEPIQEQTYLSIGCTSRGPIKHTLTHVTWDMNICKKFCYPEIHRERNTERFDLVVVLWPLWIGGLCHSGGGFFRFRGQGKYFV